MTISIVGLGPGSPELLTRQAWNALSQAKEIYVRTARHPTLEGLPAWVRINSFDYIYDQAESFPAVYSQIADEILRLGASTDVIYAVPGHPLMGEASVADILGRAGSAAIPVKVIAGLSFVEPILMALNIDALDGLQIADALEIAVAHHPPLDPDRPALLAQVYNRSVAGDVKLTLLNQYPPEHNVTLLHAVGTEFEQGGQLPLAEIDRRDDLAHLTALYIPPLPKTSGFEAFEETIAHLRAPDGCPWDREQSHQSLRRHLLEETYEVLEALDADDTEALREELGDLLLQVVLHAQIAVDSEEFRMPDVIADIDAKIKRRHPHVFGDVKVNGVQDVMHNWQAIKQAEKEENGKAKPDASALDGIPRGLPALASAGSLAEKAARLTFDWRSIDGVYDKVQEEIEELRHAADVVEREAEMGDLLFSIANLARWLKVDPESALRLANTKFSARFREVERMARSRGSSLPEMSEAELDSLWQAAKQSVG